MGAFSETLNAEQIGNVEMGNAGTVGNAETVGDVEAAETETTSQTSNAKRVFQIEFH